MKPFTFTFIFFVLFFPFTINAQINDCVGAEVVCGDDDIAFNPQGPGLNDFADPDNNEGCLVALEQNSAWYYFEIHPSAPPNLELGFIISPNGGIGEDYDWALYGPDVSCGDLGSPIRCSSSSATCGFCPETGMGMGATDVTEGPGTGDGFVSTMIVQPGQGFFLLIDNWLGTNDGFVLTWTGPAANYLNCDVTPPCGLSANAGTDIMACENDPPFSLSGSSNGANGNESYTWTGTNGGTNYLNDPNIASPDVNLPPGFTGTIIYTLSVTEDDCTGEDDMILTVNPVPTVNINQVGPFCESDPPVILSAFPFGGTWGGPVTGSTFDPMANGPGIHIVTYTFTDGNNCTTIESMDVEVFPAPDVNINPDPAEFCELDGSVVLTASGSGGGGAYSYSWSTPTGNNTGPEYYAISAGEHTVTVTDVNGCSSTAMVDVVINPNPVVLILDPGPLCESLPTYTLTGIPSGGTFSGSIVSPDGEIYPNTLSPGTYPITYSYFDNNNCEGTEALDVTIISMPNAFATNNGPLCEGQAILLYGETDGSGSNISYLWTGPGGYSSTQQYPTDASLSGDYLLQVVIDGCASQLELTEVYVTEMPDASALNNGPYCPGQTIELLGSTNATGNIITYQWAGPGGYNSTVQNPIDATLDGDYSLVITVDNCPSEMAFTEVLYNNAPDAEAINTGPYCEGDVIELYGNTNTSGNVITYTWTGPGSYTSTDQNPLDAFDPGAYGLVINVDGCISNTEITQVIINAPPQPEIMGDNAFCEGIPVTIDAGLGYDSYLWDDGTVTQTLNVNSSGTYGVTVSDGNGCTGIDAFTVSQNANPVPQITGAASFCEGDSTTLNAGGPFDEYIWNGGSIQQTIDVTVAGTYNITVTNAAGCTGTDQYIVSQNNLPLPDITGVLDFCEGSSSTLDAGGPFSEYLWSDNTNNQSLEVSASGTYSVTVTDSNGCTNTDQVNILTNPNPVPGITGNDTFCEDASSILDAGTYSTYLWSDGSTNQTLEVSASGTFSVTVTDNNACTGVGNINITVNPNPSPTIAGSTTFCAGNGTTLDAGGPYASYEWSDGSTGQTLAVSSSGTYSVIVTNSNGCTGTNQVAVTESSSLSPVISGNPEFCTGTSTVLDAGSGFSTYLWTDGTDQQTLTVTTPGDYGVIVSDNSGCTGETTVTIVENSLPSVNISGNAPFCSGESIALDAGNGFDAYEWSDQSLNQTIDVSTGGNYSVTVTDSNGCTNETQVSVIENNNPIPDITGIDAFCSGNGTTLDAGLGFEEYLWDDNSTDATLDVSSGGTYFVTVTDDNGCTGIDQFTVTENPLPEPDITGVLEFCTGLTTSIEASAGFEIYEWSNGLMTASIDISLPGTYSVIATDINGCTGSTSVLITENPNPEPLITGSSSFCIDNSTIIDAGSGYDQYEWSDGTLNQTLEVSVEGTYSVTVTNSSGCTGENQLFVEESESLNPIISGDLDLCDGETATLDAGIGFETYEWSNGETTQIINANATEDFSVTVTDTNGCSGETSASLVVFDNPIVTITGDNTFCEGTVENCDAGAGFVSYLWSDGSTGQIIMVTSGGTYTVTVTDINGCTGTDDMTIIEIPNPSPTIIGPSSFCSGNTITLEGGTGFSTYQWSDGSTSQNLSVSTGGLYSVTVTNSEGCSGEASLNVIENASLTPVISGDLAFCDGSSTLLDAGGGFETYSWSNGETSQTINPNTNEDFSVTVTDVNGCTGEASVSLVIYDNPTVSITGVNAFCEGLTEVCDAGIGFVSYLWSDGSTGQTISVSASGIYDVLVTDANGCTATDQIIITVNPNPVPTISGPGSFCSGNTATLDGGTGYDQYVWSSGSTAQSIIVSSGDLYSLTVTDTNGCTGETSLDVIENASLSPVISGTLDFCDGASTFLDAGIGFETYEWSTGEITQIIEIADGNNYGVIVTDADGCSGSANVTTQVNTNPNVTIGGSTSFCIGGFSVLDAGANYDSYVWSDGSTTQTITVATPGDYSVDVIDSNGCIGSALVTVEESTSLSPVITGDNAFCENGNTVLDAGTGFDTYLWSDGSDQQILNVVLAGDYSLTVSDNQGCSGETTVSIIEVLPPSAVLQTETELCNTEAGGSMINLYDLVLSGDINGTWNDDDNSGAVGLFNNLNFNNIPAGEYNFTYTTNSAIAPCPETTYQVMVTIIDCTCPDVLFFNADPLCNGGGVLDLSTIENTSEAGFWTIIQTPPGANPAILNGTMFDATASDPGGYLLQFDLINQPPPGCLLSFSVNVDVDPEVDAGVATAPLAYCFNDNEMINLANLITGEDNGGSWTESSAIPSQGSVFDSVNGTFETTDQVPGNYTFDYTVTSLGACPDELTSVTVVVNPLPVSVVADFVVLDCADPIQSLDASGSSSGADYSISWSGPGILLDGNEFTLNPNVNQPGLYILTITNDLTGCSAQTSTDVTSNAEPPLALAGSDDAITCDEPILTLQASGDIVSGFEIEWSGPSINAGNMNDIAPQIDQPGMYILSITNLDNNCISIPDTLIIFDETTPPDIFIQLPTSDLDCNNPSVSLTGGSVIQNVSFEWFDPNMDLFSNTDIASNVTEEGTYTLVVTNNLTGCTAAETVEVIENFEFPTLNIIPPSLLDCNNTQSTLDGTGSSTGPDMEYLWTGPTGGISGVTDQIMALAVLPGIYTFVITNNVNGCSTSMEVTIDEDVGLPNVQIATPEEMNCSITEVTLDGSGSSSGNGITYSWTDETGAEISTQESFITETPGLYELTVVNSENGCSNSSSVFVVENQDVPSTALINIDDPSCFGDDDAFIHVDQVIGGAAPYLFSLDGEPLSNSNFFPSLIAGAYELALEDANGCQWDTLISIQNPTEINLDLGADIELELGDSALIQAEVNLSFDQIDTLIWSPNNLIRCLDPLCLEGVVNTYNSLFMNATIIDTNGCRDSDKVGILMKKDRRVFIPNAFSPNGDDANEVFLIYGEASQIVTIKKFLIFNRWGEVVHEALDFQPNDVESGWDGTFKSQLMNPGVFIYLAEVVFIDGVVKVYKGDVTLMK